MEQILRIGGSVLLFSKAGRKRDGGRARLFLRRWPASPLQPEGGGTPDACALLTFLDGTQARAAFKRCGFGRA